MGAPGSRGLTLAELIFAVTAEGVAGVGGTDGPHTDTGRGAPLSGNPAARPVWECQAVIASRPSVPETDLMPAISILRGLAFSATGTTRRSTPSS